MKQTMELRVNALVLALRSPQPSEKQCCNSVSCITSLIFFSLIPVILVTFSPSQSICRGERISQHADVVLACKRPPLYSLGGAPISTPPLIHDSPQTNIPAHRSSDIPKTGVTLGGPNTNPEDSGAAKKSFECFKKGERKAEGEVI
ncbi:hypothetical protein BgiMline_012032 [Biomphalaria glabrata]|nr:hypothetical protein BgiMline_030629 [Biomphalaria glabrata]